MAPAGKRVQCSFPSKTRAHNDLTATLRYLKLEQPPPSSSSLPSVFNPSGRRRAWREKSHARNRQPCHRASLTLTNKIVLRTFAANARGPSAFASSVPPGPPSPSAVRPPFPVQNRVIHRAHVVREEEKNTKGDILTSTHRVWLDGLPLKTIRRITV